MYALVPTDCINYEHALFLRAMLEADGFPAVAAEVTCKGRTVHFVFSATPKGTADSINGIAAVFALTGANRYELIKCRLALFGESRDAVPKDKRDDIRTSLLASIKYAVEVMLPGNVVRTEPAIANPEPAPTVGHDPGDEHTEPVKTSTVDPRTDAWDDWKPGRDCNIVNGHCTVHDSPAVAVH